MELTTRHSGGLATTLAVVAALTLAACANPTPEAPAAPAAAPAAAPPPPPAPPSPPPPPPPPPTLPHAEAVLTAANTLFSKANLDGLDRNAKLPVVIDPLIDGVTRMQTKATQAMEARIVQLARASYPQFEVKPFNSANLAQSPLLIVGTFTPINQQGKTEGEREMYRFCLAMVDLKSGKVVSKTVARSRMESVDAAPLAFFADAPAWTRDPPAEGYVKTCQASKAGDSIQAAYVESLVAAALVEEGVRAYNAAKYRDALTLFTKAQATTAGQQLRVLSGVYLSQWKLGRRDAAAQAFGQIVDYGIAQRHLAMMFVFPAGAAVLPPDSRNAPNDLWLKVMAQRFAHTRSCLEVAGHASRGGPEPVNERLSSLRAEHVRRRLVDAAPDLAKRAIAAGYGSRDTLVGTARDDPSDQLDRRVELKLLACAT